MSSILDQVKQNIQKLTPEQVRERLQAMETRAAQQKVKQKERNANLSPEAKAKRTEAHKAYREKNPDKFKAQREAYNAKPEVKAKRKEYQRKRNAEMKMLRERAKELGIVVTAPAAPAAPSAPTQA
jgi:hypothetical protein